MSPKSSLSLIPLVSALRSIRTAHDLPQQPFRSPPLALVCRPRFPAVRAAAGIAAGEAEFVAGLDAFEQIPGVRLYPYLTQTVQLACFVCGMGNSTIAYLFT